MKVSRILETCLYVDDLEAAERFYTEVMGLERYAITAGRHVFFRCGEGMLLVFDPKATRIDAQNGVPPHGATGQGHVAFEMDEGEIEPWKTRLAESGVEIESDHTRSSGGRSLYFRDPSGNSIELVTRKTWRLD